MSDDTILATVDDGIATITLNRPRARNALSRAMFETLRASFASCAAREGVGVIVVRGTGGAFCAGADLTDPMMGGDLPQTERGAKCAATLDGLMHALIRDIRALPLPTLAIVNGVAAGGGVGLALAADVVIASRSATFIQPFTPKLGLVPDLGCTWHLAHHLGRARALGLALLGDPLPAAQAAGWGLIWRCIDDEDIDAEALAIARRLRDGPKRAQAMLPGLIDQAYAHTLSQQLDAERDTQALLAGSDDLAEALSAFAAKRPPLFRRT